MMGLEAIKTVPTMDMAQSLMLSNKEFSQSVDYNMESINHKIKKAAENGQGDIHYVIYRHNCGPMYKDVGKYIASLLQKDYSYHITADIVREGPNGYIIEINWNTFKNSGE